MNIAFTLLECDVGIPDTARLYKVSQAFDIDTKEGWRELYEAIIAAPKDRPLIITMPAGFLHRARTHMPAFLKVLPMLPGKIGRELRVVWVADDKRDVVESLRDFREETGGGLAIDFVKNERFCPASSFKLFDGSDERKTLEKNGGQVINFPELAYRIAQMMTNERLKHEDLLQRLDLLDRCEYEIWWNKTIGTFRAAGYLP